MNPAIDIGVFAAGVLSGLLIGWLAARLRSGERIAELTAQLARMQAELDHARRATQEKLDLLSETRSGMLNDYHMLAREALQENSHAFLDLARSAFAGYLESARRELENRQGGIQEILRPVQDSLLRYEQQIRELERSRQHAYGSLNEQVAALSRDQYRLQQETGRLARALRVPHVRGRWGEMTLRRVAELAGMVNRCDFFEQPGTTTENGMQRPDMVVHLPGSRLVAVDAKAPLDAYLKALEAEDEHQRQAMLKRHLAQLESHITKLSRKSYWAGIQPSPEFTVLFIPGENFFSAALAQNDRLLEFAADKGIVLASPVTLISLLKTVALVWRQETAAQNASAIAELGRELYGRLLSLTTQLQSLGNHMEKCVSGYNRMVGSFERRVLVSARKFEQFGIAPEKGAALPRVDPLEKPVRKPEGKGDR